MTLSNFVRLLISIYVLLLFSNCERKPIISQIGDSEGLIRDTIIYNIDSFTYQSPPNIGTFPNLYFGSDSGYNSRFTLINIANYSSDLTVTFPGLTDSLIESIDSLFFIITSKDTVMPEVAETYHFNYFQSIESDSLFNEASSNYLNLEDSSQIFTMFNEPLVSVAIMSIDDTVATHPFVKFDLTESRNDIINSFADTAGGVKNRSFVIWKEESTTGISSFFSRNATSFRPRLQVHYQKNIGTDSTGAVILDTLFKSFYPDNDLSIIYPPALISADTTLISVGRAKGLQSILQFDVDSNTFPVESVIRSAKLTLYPDTSNSDLGGYVIGLYSILDSQAVEDPDGDPYLIQIDLPDPAVGANAVELDLKIFVGAVTLKQFENYGLKIISTSANDPFEIARFDSDTSSINDFRPRLRVIYVTP